MAAGHKIHRGSQALEKYFFKFGGALFLLILLFLRIQPVDRVVRDNAKDPGHQASRVGMISLRVAPGQTLAYLDMLWEVKTLHLRANRNVMIKTCIILVVLARREIQPPSPGAGGARTP